MSKLASIVTIATAEPIPGSDRLDVVTMKGKGWRVVTGRGEFRPGETAVYFEIDSALPADDERYAFLRDRCLRTWTDKRGNVLRQAIRIRTVKLRGEGAEEAATGGERSAAEGASGLRALRRADDAVLHPEERA